MSFAAPLFLWYFLPVVLVAHWVLPARCRNGVLAVCSIAFYAVGGKEFVLLLLAMMVVNYSAGLGIGAVRSRPRGSRFLTPKSILVATVTADLVVLAVWKYLGFASVAVDQLGRALGSSGSPVIEVALPIGISFFTFHHLSYVVDIYRGTRTPMRNPLTFATYIAMFPQLIAGPIVRYHEIADQLRDQAHDRWGDFVDGFPRFAWGLFKKVVIADALAPIADTAFASDNPSFATAWVGALAYTGQIYFDFSGYSDMAIGLALLLGAVVPCVTSVVGVADQGVGVEPGQALSGHALLLGNEGSPTPVRDRARSAVQVLVEVSVLKDDEGCAGLDDAGGARGVAAGEVVRDGARTAARSRDAPRRTPTRPGDRARSPSPLPRPGDPARDGRPQRGPGCGIGLPPPRRARPPPAG